MITSRTDNTLIMHKWPDGCEMDTQEVALARTDIGVNF
jgi:hypothetical protein